MRINRLLFHSVIFYTAIGCRSTNGTEQSLAKRGHGPLQQDQNQAGLTYSALVDRLEAKKPKTWNLVDRLEKNTVGQSDYAAVFYRQVDGATQSKTAAVLIIIVRSNDGTNVTKLSVGLAGSMQEQEEALSKLVTNSMNIKRPKVLDDDFNPSLLTVEIPVSHITGGGAVTEKVFLEAFDRLEKEAVRLNELNSYHYAAKTSTEESPTGSKDDQEVWEIEMNPQ